MFAKDAPFHFVLASHLQPVDQVDDPIILNKIRYKMKLGGWGVEYSTHPRDPPTGLKGCHSETVYAAAAAAS